MANYYLNNDGLLTNKKKKKGNEYALQGDGSLKQINLPVQPQQQANTSGLFKGGDSNVGTGLLASTGDFLADIGQGFMRTLEGVSDFSLYAGSENAKIASNLIENVFGQNVVSDYYKGISNLSKETGKFESTASLFGTNENAQETLFGNEWRENLNKASYLGDLADSIGEGIGNIGAMAALSSIGGAGMGAAGVGVTETGALTTGGKLLLSGSTSFTSAFGNAKSEAYKNGADDITATRSGFINGLAEAVSEQFFDSMPGIKSAGFADKIGIKDFLANKLKSGLGTSTAKVFLKLVGGFEEGAEEMISNALVAVGNDLMHMVDQSYTYGMENQSGNPLEDGWNQLFSEDSIKSFMSAGLTSVILGAGGDTLTTAQTNQVINAFAKDNNMSFKEAKALLGGENLNQAQEQVKREGTEISNNVELEEAAKQRIINYMKANKGKGIESRIEALVQNEAQKKGIEYTPQELKIEADKIRAELIDQTNSPDRYMNFVQTDKETNNELAESFRKAGVNNSQQAHEMYNFVSKLQETNKNLKYQVVNNKMLKEMGQSVEGATINGFNQDGTIYINMDAKNPYQAVAYHEIAHSIKDTSPELYNELKNLVFELKGREGLENYRKLYRVNDNELASDLTENVEDEFINDQLGEILNDDNFINKIDNRNIIQKLIDEIKRVVKYMTSSKDQKALMKTQQRLEEIYKQGLSEAESKEGTAFSLGKHYGDLGKGNDTYYFQMANSRRGTGHFGTGTYFVNEEYQPGESSSYANRPTQSVEFDDYNLFKPQSANDGFDLHDALKEVNYNNNPISQELYNELTPYYEASFRAYNELLSEEEENNYSKVRGLLEQAGIETEEYDGYNSLEYERDLEDKITDVLNDYDRYQGAKRDLERILGITDAQFNKSMQEVRDAKARYDNTDEMDLLKADSLSTIFMKSLGYNGIDVRGYDQLDNTTYGSVIYDLNNKKTNYSLSEGLEAQGTKIFEQAEADYQAARQNILDYLEENNIENPTKQDMMDAYGWYDEYDASQDMQELQRAERIYNEAADDLLKERQQPRYSLTKASPEQREQATKLEEQGKSVDDIYLETGIYRGADGLWRSEIDDSDAKIKIDLAIKPGRDGLRYKLKDILDHDKLYEAYPEFKELNVIIKDLPDTYNGFVDSDGDIYIDTSNYDYEQHAIERLEKYYKDLHNEVAAIIWGDQLDNQIKKTEEQLNNFNYRTYQENLKSILLHEIQHKIQDKEGFAKGSNTGDRQAQHDKYMENIREFNKDLSELYEKSGISTQWVEENMPRVISGEITMDEFFAEQKEARLKSPVGSLIREKLEDKEDYEYRYGVYERDAFDLYQNTAGEIEAREVQKRMNMSPEERQANLPFIKDEKTLYTEPRLNRKYGVVKDSDTRYSLSQDSQGRELSEQQQNFFSDSKVRDSEGRLLEVYHGTEANMRMGEGYKFTIFDEDRQGSNGSLFGDGFYFTTNREGANQYAANGRGDIYSVYLNIENPFVAFSNPNLPDGSTYYDDLRLAFPELQEYQGRIPGNIIKNTLIRNGYDGIQIDEDYVAFYSNQIKNVDNTEPTSSLDIRYSLAQDTNLEEDLEKYVYPQVYENYKYEDKSKITKTIEELEEYKKTLDADTDEGWEKNFKANAQIRALEAGFDNEYDYYVDQEKTRLKADAERGVGMAARLIEEGRQNDQKNNQLQEDIANATPKQNKQFEIIQATNPAPNDQLVWIRSPLDIKTFEQVVNEEDGFGWGDYSLEDAKKDLKRNKVRVYSSYAIKNGTFVSTSYQQALDYAGGDASQVHSREVNPNNIAWISGDEGQYASENARYSLSLDQRVSGDELLDAQDFIDEVRSVGADVDENGYVTLYHQTSDENAAKIRDSGIMTTAGEDYLYFSTSQDAQQAAGRGGTKLEFKIPAEKLILDDLFDDNADVKIALNGNKSLDVSQYLQDKEYSLSQEQQEANSLLKVIESYDNYLKTLPSYQKLQERQEGTPLSNYTDESHGILTKEDYKNKKIELFDKQIEKADNKMEEQAKRFARENLELTRKAREQLQTIIDKYKGQSRESIFNSNAKEEIREFVRNNSRQEFVEEIIDEETRDLQRAIRNTELVISKENGGEFADGITAFKKNNPGLKIKYGNQNIDSVYQELAEQYPGMLETDVNDKDIPFILADVLRKSYRHFDNSNVQVFELNDSEIENIANKIYRGLTNNAISDEQLEALTKEISQKVEDKYARAMASEKYREIARNTIDVTDIKDKKRGIQYKVNTMKRNLRDIMSKEQAQLWYDTYFKPITIHNAQSEIDKQDYVERIQKYNLNNAESTYTQMLGELKYNPETDLTSDQVEQFAEKHNVDKQKCTEAVEEFRNIYDELIVRVNEALKANGYKPIDYRKGYFPHFIEDKPNSIIGKFADKFGWNVQKGTLPTDIAGLTDGFKPGKAWTPFSQQRTGDNTDYNALKGMDNYLRGAMDLIYHTEDIQKLRALENEIRYQYSSDGIKTQIDSIYANQELSPEEKAQQIALLTDNVRDNPLGNLVTELRDYTNGLANKKSILDRGMEQALGRDWYSIMNNINGRVSANMVGANLSSAMTNFIPITQAWSQVSTKNLMRGMYESIRNTLKNDGFDQNSVYLTNRTQQAEQLYQTTLDKVNQKLGLLFEGIDSFTSNTIVRAKYYENLDKGMSEQAAMENADEYAKDVMAGRSKGDSPTIFNSKNPLYKMFTAFQLEVNNQYGYMFKDLPADLGDEGKEKLAMAFMKMFIGAWLYNMITEKITGRKAAFSPIDMVADEYETATSDMDLATKVQNIAKDVAQETPFLGGIMGGGRLPLQSSIPYENPLDMVTKTFENIGTALGDDESKKKTAINSLKKEWLKPVYYIALPFAGGQIKKSIEGLSMYDENLPVAGSYTDAGKLRFEADTSPLGKAQALLFGQYASENAREYFDKGYTPLTEKQINEALDANLPISEYREVKKGLTKAANEAKENNESQAEAKTNYIYNLPLSDEQKNVLVNNALNRKEDIDLSNYGDYGSLEEFDYANDNPDKYRVITQITNYDTYQTYKDNIAAIKDKYSTTDERKSAVFNYINSLNLNMYQKLMLQKMAAGYSIKNYKRDMHNYIENLQLSAEEKQKIDDELFS